MHLKRPINVHFSAIAWFSQISDGWKFWTVKDRNFKFSGNAQLHVRRSAYREEQLTVHYGWSENAMKMSKMYSFLCERPILAFLFCPIGFLLELRFSTNNKPCTSTQNKYRKVWYSCFRYILIDKIRSSQRNEYIFVIFTTFPLQLPCTVKCFFPCALQRTSSWVFCERFKFLCLMVQNLQPSDVYEK